MYVFVLIVNAFSIKNYFSTNAVSAQFSFLKNGYRKWLLYKSNKVIQI